MVVVCGRGFTVLFELLLVAGILIADISHELQPSVPVVADFTFHTFDMDSGIVDILQHTFFFDDGSLYIVVHITQKTVCLVIDGMTGGRTPCTEQGEIDIVTLLRL